MQITLFTNVFFERWRPDTPDTRGIGGSETSQIELATRLAARGHDVVSYAPVPWTGEVEVAGVKWIPLEEADFTRKGVWFLYRCPEILDQFPVDHFDQQLYLVSQDETYSSWNEERVAKLDWFVALCETHAYAHAYSYPALAPKIRVSSNGIKMELIRKIEAENIKRNPKKLIYASSPDRGLATLLPIFRRARTLLPDLELDIFYSFENIDRILEQGHEWVKPLARLKEKIMRDADQPGVTWRGRVSQPDLIRAWFSAGLWVHPSLFSETSAITCMEAQACGAVPITTPTWAVGENVMHGIFIEGDVYQDGLVQSRYVYELIGLAKDAEIQEQIRKPMMEDARARFNWERIVDQLESWIYGYDNVEGRSVFDRFAFQLKQLHELPNAGTRILNIGCDEDAGKLKAISSDVVNLDVQAYHPLLKRENPIDVLHDAREPLPFEPRSFDAVVIGDVIEHMTHEDTVKMFRNAAAVLRTNGRLIVTYPEDRRTRQEQNVHNLPDYEEYVDGVKAYHHHISRQQFVDMVMEAGFDPEVVQHIDYGFTTGWGCVARLVHTVKMRENQPQGETVSC